jgi:hypothetical protein
VIVHVSVDIMVRWVSGHVSKQVLLEGRTLNGLVQRSRQLIVMG